LPVEFFGTNATTITYQYDTQGMVVASSANWITTTTTTTTVNVVPWPTPAWQQAWQPPPRVVPQPRWHDTEEVRAERRARREAAYAEAAASRVAAQVRAEETLLRLLPEAERAHYQDRQLIRVRGSAGGLYEIERGYQQNVYAIDEAGRRTERLCAHPHMYDNEGGSLPYEDAMIAQLLQLRHDEPAFLTVANRTRLRAAY